MEEIKLRGPAGSRSGIEMSDESELFQITDDHEIGILKIKEIIDNTANMVFASYKQRLLSEPITYIVQAVWGKRNEGFSVGQENIHAEINCMVKDILDIFEFDEISEAQNFAIEYLIRGLVISKVMYLIEACKNQKRQEIRSIEEGLRLLDRLEPLGNA